MLRLTKNAIPFLRILQIITGETKYEECDEMNESSELILMNPSFLRSVASV